MAPVIGPDDGAANHNVVFIDTSLDTHLAIIVSDSDTVSDFKRKVMLEHRLLFPAIGDIKVECLKVKRKGSFYHLSDSMPVKSALVTAKRNWFVLVDASRLEQSDGSRELGQQKAGDRLALPWVTRSCSVERHDNRGSPSVHSKTAPLETAPLVNQKVLNVDQLASGDSFKDVSKYVEEYGLCNDKQLDCEPQEKLDTVNTDINSKKRTLDMSNESLPKDAFGYGLSVNKKRKTQRGRSNVKDLEENLALTHDNDKVNDKGASINKGSTIGHKPEGKDLSDENERTNTTVVTTIEGVRSETEADVAMVVENNIQQEMSVGMSQKEKDDESIQKPTTENEEHSSLMRTPDSEHDAAVVTATGHMKRSTQHKATEKEVISTSFIKELHNTNKEATETSQQDVGSSDQEYAGDQFDKSKDDLVISLKQRPELKLPGRKKARENTGEGKRRKSKRFFKHLDNLVGEISSTVLASAIDENKTNEVSEIALVDATKGDDVVMKEVEVPRENMEEKSMKEFPDTNDVVTVTNEENLWPNLESPMNDAADILLTIGKSTNQVNAQGTLDNLEKQNELLDDTMKKKRKKKSKRSVNRDICENVKESETCLPNTDRKDGDISSTVLASVIDEIKLNEDSEKTLKDAKKADEVIVKDAENSVENMEEISKKEFKDANDVVTVTDEENILLDTQKSTIGNNTSQVNAQCMLGNSEKQNEKTDDTTKKKKKKKTKKSAGRNEDESMPKNADGDVKEGDRKDDDKVKEKDAQASNDRLASKESKNNKSQDLQLELPSNKSQSVDHHHLSERTSKNVTASEVSKADNMKKTKVDSRNDQSKKRVSKNENKVSANVLKDPNIANTDVFKTPKRTKKIDAEKPNRQQSTLVQTRVKTVESKKANGAQKVTSLLTPGRIFADDSDSDSSRHTPSAKSSSSSSSGESSYIQHSRRTRKGNESAEKLNGNSQSGSKKSFSELLRSSRSFKKSKVIVSSQVEDTDAPDVDIVQDSQP